MKKEHIINVKPFKNKHDLNEFLNELARTKHAERNCLIAKFGLITGLRISDILQLKKKDIVGKTQATIREKKTSKLRTIYFETILKEIIEYTNKVDLSDTIYLFPAPKDVNKHLSEHQYYKILAKVADSLSMNFIGTHTLRKSFGYFYYQKTKDIATLQTIFNHSSQKITLRYLDITEDEIRNSLIDFKPF